MCDMLHGWWSSPGEGWRKGVGKFATIHQIPLWWETRKIILRELSGVCVGYTNDQLIDHTGVAPPNKKIKLRSQVHSVQLLFAPTYIYTQMEVFAKIVNGFKPLVIWKSFILDVWQCSKYASGKVINL